MVNSTVCMENMDRPRQVLSSEEYNIDNIIESAVDELLQKKVTAQSDFVDVDVLLLSLCRLCAQESQQLVKIPEASMMLVCDLKIPGLDRSSANTSICNCCIRMLEDIERFRGLVADGQKRIVAMLTHQNMLPDFLNLDFTDSKKDASADINPSQEETRLQNKANEAVVKQNPPDVTTADVVHRLVEDEPSSENSSTLKHKKHPRRKTALNVQRLVKSLAAEDGEGNSTDSSDSDAQMHNDDKSEQNSSEDFDPVPSPTQAKPPKKPNPTKRKRRLPSALGGADEKKQSSSKLQSRRRMIEGRLEWVCLDCELVFESCLKLKKHRQNCELVGSERSKRYGSFPCETCGVVLNTFAALCLHRYKHGSTGMAKKAPKEKICHVCGKIFKTARTLNKHLSVHVSEKKFVCQICDKSFARGRYLRNHMEIHSGLKQHECSDCGKRFTTSATLRNHRETHKPNYRRQQCLICSKRFAHPYLVRKHMMVHTAEYPYSCDICNALFRKPSQLSRHVQTGHAPPVQTDSGPEQQQPDRIVDFDDLIVYQPEDDLEVMFDTMKEEMPQLAQNVAMSTLPQQEQPFATDHLLAEATRHDYTVEGFPEVHETDHEIYCFMEF